MLQSAIQRFLKMHFSELSFFFRVYCNFEILAEVHVRIGIISFGAILGVKKQQHSLEYIL